MFSRKLLKKSRFLFFLLGAAFLVALVQGVGGDEEAPPRLKTARVELLGRFYTLELARTPSQRREGLMHRKSLATDAGMLFVFEQSGYYRIWMKNTWIPLTVVWVDDSETVVGVKQLQPCTGDPCPTYGVDAAAKYIIEFSLENNHFKPGDYLPELKSLR